MKSPLKYNFNNQGMLIFAAMMLMSFFMGISAVMAKITITMKKTSTSSLTTWKQDIQVQNILAAISYQLLNNASNPNGSGVTWQNSSGAVLGTNPSTGFLPLSNVISILAKDSANFLKSTTTNTWTNPFVTAEDDHDFSIINIRNIATTVNPISHPLSSSLGLIPPQYGGYVVETIHVQPNTGNTGATYCLKISAYVCDSGSDTSTCYPNSNISAASMVITTTRTCPLSIGASIPQLVATTNPGDSFYSLNCVCSTGTLNGSNQCQ